MPGNSLGWKCPKLGKHYEIPLPALTLDNGEKLPPSPCSRSGQTTRGLTLAKRKEGCLARQLHVACTHRACQPCIFDELSPSSSCNGKLAEGELSSGPHLHQDTPPPLQCPAPPTCRLHNSFSHFLGLASGTDMTGRPGERTTEMNGGITVSHLACTPCVHVFLLF